VKGTAMGQAMAMAAVAEETETVRARILPIRTRTNRSTTPKHVKLRHIVLRQHPSRHRTRPTSPTYQQSRQICSNRSNAQHAATS